MSTSCTIRLLDKVIKQGVVVPINLAHALRGFLLLQRSVDERIDESTYDILGLCNSVLPKLDQWPKFAIEPSSEGMLLGLNERERKLTRWACAGDDSLYVDGWGKSSESVFMSCPKRNTVAVSRVNRDNAS